MFGGEAQNIRLLIILDEARCLAKGVTPSLAGSIFGSPRYFCVACQTTYTPVPQEQGYAPEIRHLAIKLYLEGNGFRRIARLLDCHHQTVANWIAAYQKQLQEQTPDLPVPKTTETVELDELSTFIGSKKRFYLVTAVDCAIRCIVGFAVLTERAFDTMQPVVDQAQGASQYYSDGLETYRMLLYATGTHAVAPGKSQTYSVEGDNADLRHYLGRLHRRNRCFSRCQ